MCSFSAVSGNSFCGSNVIEEQAAAPRMEALAMLVAIVLIFVVPPMLCATQMEPRILARAIEVKGVQLLQGKAAIFAGLVRLAACPKNRRPDDPREKKPCPADPVIRIGGRDTGG